MIFDQSSFLLAIGCAAAALAITTLVMWLGAQKYKFLFFWGAGLAFCVPSVATLGAFMEPYRPAMNFVAYVLLITGVVFIEASGRQFRTGRFDLRISLVGWLVSLAFTGFGFGIGLSGLGVIFLNVACGGLFLGAAVEFWRGRSEAPIAVTAVAVLYGTLALSFFLCPVPLIQGQSWVLYSHPDNWAETLNSVCVIFALAGNGALMLVLAQGRVTQLQRKAAMNDVLTGLFNRRALFDIAQQRLAPGTAAIMFDLDYFKRINDRFGHAVGDEVLSRFARVMRESLRAEDIAARMGGEEFCVVLSGRSSRGAYEVAERIRARFAATEPLAADFGAPTVSAGVAVSNLLTSSFEDLLRLADQALYQAKTAGRNRVQGPDLQLVA